MEYIYKITSPSNKVYIGRAKNFDTRMIEHKSLAERGGGYTIHQAIRKYGWDNMTREIICEVSTAKAKHIEEQFIRAYDSVNTGYNDTYNCGGQFPYENMRDTEAYQTYIKKMSLATSGEKNGMYGKSHSEEAKQKQREKAQGRFSLDWFIDRNGKEEGERLYEERRQWLKNRNLKKDENGRFVKSKTK